MGKSKTGRVKKRRKRKKSAVEQGGGSTKKAARAGGGGVMQGMRASIKRVAGADRGRKDDKPSTLSNVLWTVVLLLAVAFLIYRYYGQH